MLAKGNGKETAFHGALLSAQTGVLQKTWDWGNDKLSPGELKSNFY